MSSEDNPIIQIDYYDATWKSILADAISFTVKDGGVFSGCTASIDLNNKDGKYTSGATKIPIYSKVRIRGDVRDAIDTIFEGRYQQRKMEYKDVKNNEVTLLCTGYEVLLGNYAKTEKWKEDFPQYTYEEVILRCLSVPDSWDETGLGTGITLETDSGAIKNQHALEQTSQETLSSIIRDICERINYAGYMKDEGTKLVLKAVGTEPSNPLVSLADPFVFVRPVFDITEVKNYVMPWDENEPHIPPDERLTENVMANYPDAWSASSGIVLSDSEVHQQGSYSLKAVRNSGFGEPIIKLDCSKVDMGTYIDLTETRFKNGRISMWFRSELASPSELTLIRLKLKDTNGTIIGIPHWFGPTCPWFYHHRWYNLRYPIGPDTPIQASYWYGALYGGWFYESGTNFNWELSEVSFETQIIMEIGEILYIDGLWFEGPKSIDPIIYHELIKKDQSNIDAYGHRTLALSDSTLSSFINAQALAQYNLDVLKTPIQKVEVKKGAKIWVKPSQTVTITVPQAEISGTWRTVETQTDWKNKILRTAFKCVPQYDPITRRTLMMDDIVWLLTRR